VIVPVLPDDVVPGADVTTDTGAAVVVSTDVVPVPVPVPVDGDVVAETVPDGLVIIVCSKIGGSGAIGGIAFTPGTTSGTTSIGGGGACNIIRDGLP